MRGLIFGMALSSLCICVVSILSDRYKQQHMWQGNAFLHFPRDTHFRCITAMKVGMVIVKIDFLMTYAKPKDHGAATIMQVISIAFSLVCANWSIIGMLNAALDISHEFAGMFRYPVALWRSSIMCLVLWHSVTGLLLLLAVGDVIGIEKFVFGAHIPSPQDLSWLGVVLPLMSKWLYMGNELALVLSSRLSHPQVFAAVQSRQGIAIVATVGAIGTPMTMLCKTAMWLFYCENRKVGVDDITGWETWLCIVVSGLFIIGAIVSYASLG
uniref:Uncharacterized protein n=1 Tax=Zooxanthella nutricula TaxID=1333877 RepID=A0A7S2NBU2_9DINO